MSQIRTKWYVNALIEQDDLHHTEGQRGLQNLARLANALGYRDLQHYGQFERNVCLGDIFEFLQDNRGAIEALQGWIQTQQSDTWTTNLKQCIDDHSAVNSDEGDELA